MRADSIYHLLWDRNVLCYCNILAAPLCCHVSKTTTMLIEFVSFTFPWFLCPKLYPDVYTTTCQRFMVSLETVFIFPHYIIEERCKYYTWSLLLNTQRMTWEVRDFNTIPMCVLVNRFLLLSKAKRDSWSQTFAGNIVQRKTTMTVYYGKTARI